MNKFSSQKRDEMIYKLFPVARKAAGKYKRKLPPNYEFDDLVGAGMLGAIKAVDACDGIHETRFAAYARQKICGAIMDFLRDEDPLTRPQRARVRAGKQEDLRITSYAPEMERPAEEKSIRRTWDDEREARSVLDIQYRIMIALYVLERFTVPEIAETFKMTVKDCYDRFKDIKRIMQANKPNKRSTKHQLVRD